MAGAISLGRDDGVTTTETIAYYLGPRRVLLVLANCEHVRDAVRTSGDGLFATVSDTARRVASDGGPELFRCL